MSTTFRTARKPRSWDRVAPYLFLTPFLVSFVLFFAVPSISSVYLSFFSYRGYGTPIFAGFNNYAALLQSPDFWSGVQNTLFYWLVPLVPLVVGGFVLALLVRSKLARGARVIRPIFYVPQVMAPVAAALVWQVMFSNVGVINTVLRSNAQWLTDPSLVRWSVAILLLWRGLGWYFVVFLAGMTGVPDELLEAAQIDGASPLQRVRYIVVPTLKPIFLFAVVIDTIQSLQLFTEPNLLLGSDTSSSIAPPSGAPIMNQVVNNITGGQFGLASAVGWLIFLAVALISIVQFRLFRERNS